MSRERTMQTLRFEDTIVDTLLAPANNLALGGITRVASEITGEEPGEWVVPSTDVESAVELTAEQDYSSPEPIPLNL